MRKDAATKEMRRLRALPLSYDPVNCGTGGIRTRCLAWVKDVVPSAFAANCKFRRQNHDDKGLRETLLHCSARLSYPALQPDRDLNPEPMNYHVVPHGIRHENRNIKEQIQLADKESMRRAFNRCSPIGIRQG
jgi:hypothetical protein